MYNRGQFETYIYGGQFFLSFHKTWCIAEDYYVRNREDITIRDYSS